MNVYDAERMKDILRLLEYEDTEKPDDADLVIFNTCYIREKASAKLFSEIGKLTPYKNAKKAKGQRMVIAVAGCVAQALGDEIKSRVPFVDIVLGTQAYHRFSNALEVVLKQNSQVVDTEFPPESKFDFLPENKTNAVSAFLAVQEGCDKFCHYCVVPYTRGAEYSRPIESIMKEADILLQQGVKEITLLGQNVSAYHGIGKDGKTNSLSGLIHKIADIKELTRLRIMTSHPMDITEELIDCFANVPKLMPFFHLPVQHGSDKILKAMNRKHDADYYKRLIERIRKKRPDIAMSSDFIAGFPGETDKDFEDMLSLVKEIGFAQAFSFKYSSRPGTPAADMPNQIPEEIKEERLYRLQDLLRSQQLAFNRNMIGKKTKILFDDNGKHGDKIFGRTPYMQPAFIELTGNIRENLLGQEREVVINEAVLNNVKGKLV
ncbi:MAG: tRNA (N6-isopentenyl adenosine(37)-C2)-methylthiotransferase MiaB [Alphaproteobacteria bacterium]|nr:tRNA (N6-isopentenyl adenosine(37)-C2)-methylthiotransferase MiaB [Alphaproteobacteria bacterium]